MEQVRIIGRGTWLDKVAHQIIEREKGLGRDISLIRVESGLAASGIPHIGSVGDAIRSYGVKLALESMGYKSELIAFSDDFDGLRRVPDGMPSWLNDYISKPVSMIPDPFGCHGSYAQHMGSLLIDSLDRLGIEYKFYSGSEAYRKGILNEQIRKILSNSEIIGRKIKEMVMQEKYEQRLPYTPLCKNCGRIYTTAVYRYEKDSDEVYYRCEGTELRDRYIHGCGYEGRAKISDGNGKLIWKVEFAARWAALDIRFEAYGKELTDSVKINDWVSENILSYPPPYHVRYELFQDKSGRKLSKSTGNLVTPQEWLEYASPESLRLLMFKRIVGARNISLLDIPFYMDEFDELEDYYFSDKRDHNVLKDAKLRGLYEYSMLLKIPKEKRVHVPYRLLAELSSIAPESNLEDFVIKRLIAYGMVKNSSDELIMRIRYASRWAKRFAKSEAGRFEIGADLAGAINEFAERILNCKDANEVQSIAFDTLRKHGLRPDEFFKAVYRILLGSDRGPRLGPYVIDAGIKSVRERLINALSSR